MDFRKKLNIINKLYFNEENNEFFNDELTRIENDLKISLPQALKDFYMIFGNRENFLGVMNSILLPPKIYIENNVLVFVEENQSVCSYGFDINSHKIFYLSNNLKEEIGLDIEDFLIYILALQGMGHLGCIARLESRFVDIVKKNFILLTKKEGRGAVYFDADVIFVDVGDSIYISAKNDESMAKIESKYNLVINYL